MYQFLQYIADSDIDMVALKHTGMPIPIPDENKTAYLVKLEQELTLDTDEIFNYVKSFDDLAGQYSGDYIGWESQDIKTTKIQLH